VSLRQIAHRSIDQDAGLRAIGVDLVRE